MSKHWYFVRKGCRIYDARGNKIADVSASFVGEDGLNERGNLIAAAPALLEALERAGEYFEQRADIDGDNEKDGDEEMSLLVEIEVAIKKARP